MKSVNYGALFGDSTDTVVSELRRRRFGLLSGGKFVRERTIIFM